MDVLKDYDWKEYSDCRKFIIDIILHTDMAKHFPYQTELNEKLDRKEVDLKADKRFIIKGLVHAVDIGAQGKPFHLAKLWSMKILSEFFAQGDQERELGFPEISFLCDRYNVNIAQSQVGFIDGIVSPIFKTFERIFPEVKATLSQLEDNKQVWQSLVKDYEEEKETGNSHI